MSALISLSFILSLSLCTRYRIAMNSRHKPDVTFTLGNLTMTNTVFDTKASTFYPMMDHASMGVMEAENESDMTLVS